MRRGRAHRRRPLGAGAGASAKLRPASLTRAPDRFHRAGGYDINRLEAWLIERGAPYARGLGLELVDAIEGLIDFPGRAPVSRDGRYRERYIAFHSNQYVVQYLVRGDAVVIARIRHSLERR
ncbi:type II toxin-antitoxin system RelE/ParE family toxin [Caulobacter sp. FWC2]|uniref:type II toxin-antitoxin system RelE/ParE family toxin n=1 Tax=Caulobacter sp. FWC2 TaxID=69664 RepID=UPI003512939A